MFKLNRRSFMLSTAALAASSGIAGRAVAQSNASGTIRILMNGGDADLANTNNAIARFNKKFPNYQVSVDMDPISTGWGDFVTKVLGEFASNSQHDIYGTAIETFQTFASRGVMEPIEATVTPGETLKESLGRIEAWLIRRALERCEGRRAETARRLGITREGLYK